MIYNCNASSMMWSAYLIFVLTIHFVSSTPAAYYETYPIGEKRAALVLDRLMIALKSAMERGEHNGRIREVIEEPHVAPLRDIPDINLNDMTALQRRGQATNSRGRVLRCYFNAVTCF